MANFNFEYMGDYLQYKDSQGNTLIVNGGIINDTATGAVAEFTDGAENIPVKSLTVTLEPIQSGTGDPSPENIRPIDGRSTVTVTRAGKNLLKPSEYGNDGITKIITTKGNLTVNGDEYFFTPTGTNDDAYFGSIGFSFPVPQNIFNNFIAVPIFTGGTYTIQITNSTYFNKNFAQVLDGDLNRITTSPQFSTSITLTVTDEARWIIIRCGSESLTAGNTYTTKIQVEKSASATAYAPPQFQTVTIQLGDTIYGGTVDVTNGVMTVNRMTVDLGELMWRYRSDVGEGLFSTTNVNDYKYTPDTNAICSALKYDGTVGGIALVTTDKSVCFYYAAGSPERLIYVYDTDYSDAVSFKNAMDGVKLCYELAQPITVQLTPEQLTTLLGTNNIWSDADSVSVDYVADTKLYIQNAISDSV